jgi:hypothetical protein
VGSVESLFPLAIPIQEIGVSVKALGKILFGEFLDEGRVDEIGLCFEFLCRVKILLFFPVDGDLSFRELAFGGY